VFKLFIIDHIHQIIALNARFIALHSRMFCIHTNHRFPFQSPPLFLSIR